MASGSTSAHSKKRRPGKSSIVVNQAAVTPIEATPRPTPTHSTTVLKTNSPSTVSARCAQVSLVCPTNTLENTDSTGAAISAATSTADSVSVDPCRRLAPHTPEEFIPFPSDRGLAAHRPAPLLSANYN